MGTSRKRGTRRMAEPHIYVPGAEAVILRSVPGEGEQVEVVIKTREGDLVVRLMSPRGRGLRVINLRPADKKRQRATQALSVPFPSELRAEVDA